MNTEDQIAKVTEAILDHQCKCNDPSAEIHRDSLNRVRCGDCDGLVEFFIAKGGRLLTWHGTLWYERE